MCDFLDVGDRPGFSSFVFCFECISVTLGGQTLIPFYFFLTLIQWIFAVR